MQLDFMRRALELAKTAGDMGEVPIGCVIVKDGVITGEGYNRRETDNSALAHAEIIAINDANKRLGGWRLHECDLYVTLEPCPMCAGAIINARIKTVYFGAYDPKSGACVSKLPIFEYGFNHKPVVTGGLLTKESSEMLSSFFKKLR